MRNSPNYKTCETQIHDSAMSVWLKLVCPTFLPVLIGIIGSPVFAQQPGRKVKPASSGKMDIREIERRERESRENPTQKKLENDNLKEPGTLPVPKGAHGKTFRSTAKKKSRLT
jgi:hypothetical protein